MILSFQQDEILGTVALSFEFMVPKILTSTESWPFSSRIQRFFHNQIMISQSGSPKSFSLQFTNQITKTKLSDPTSYDWEEVKCPCSCITSICTKMFFNPPTLSAGLLQKKPLIMKISPSDCFQALTIPLVGQSGDYR